MRYLLMFLFTCTAAIACTPALTTRTPGDETMKRLEVLHAVTVGRDVIEITVIGSGCTLAEHFLVETERVNGSCRVSIYRTQPDRCRRAPMPVTLELPWKAAKECAQAKIKIQNPLQAVASDR